MTLHREYNEVDTECESCKKLKELITKCFYNDYTNCNNEYNCDECVKKIVMNKDKEIGKLKEIIKYYFHIKKDVTLAKHNYSVNEYRKEIEKILEE